ncbi:MAG: TlpA disulfide reductase family protein [Hyphomicrobiaceae bacterium]
MSLSYNLVLQWFAALALICGGFALAPFHALAEQTTKASNLTQAKSASRNLVENDGELATSQLSAPVPATAHENGDDHRHAHKGSVVQVENTAELKEHVVAGINTKSADLRALLRPGTIIHFWASWCGPCVEEIPQLERFYRDRIVDKLKAKGIRLITISNDRAIAPAARFIKKHGTTFPAYLDKEQASNLAIVGQRGLPSTVLVDADGRFHRLALGKFDWGFPDLAEILTATAARKPNIGSSAKAPVK